MEAVMDVDWSLALPLAGAAATLFAVWWYAYR
jgi:hypothetical protein